MCVYICDCVNLSLSVSVYACSEHLSHLIYTHTHIHIIPTPEKNNIQTIGG